MSKKKHNTAKIDAHIELDNLSTELNMVTKRMEKRRLGIKNALLIFFVATTIYCILMIWSLYTNMTNNIMFWALLVLYVVIVLFCHLVIRHDIKRYKEIDSDGRGVLSKMVRIIDWKEFRSRQFYNGNNLDAVKYINLFLSENQRRLSPVRYGVSYTNIYTLLLTIWMTLLLAFLFLIFRDYLVDFILSVTGQSEK